MIAESDDTVVGEGNHYFPRESVVRAHVRESSTRTTCGSQGEAHDSDVVVGGAIEADAAWSDPSPEEEAREIAGRVAFWKGASAAE